MTSKVRAGELLERPRWQPTKSEDDQEKGAHPVGRFRAPNLHWKSLPSFPCSRGGSGEKMASIAALASHRFHDQRLSPKGEVLDIWLLAKIKIHMLDDLSWNLRPRSTWRQKIGIMMSPYIFQHNVGISTPSISLAAETLNARCIISGLNIQLLSVVVVRKTSTYTIPNIRHAPLSRRKANNSSNSVSACEISSPSLY